MDPVITSILNSRQAMAPVLKQLSDSDTGIKRSQTQASRELHCIDNVDTMYGTMLTKLEVTTEDGGKVAIDWINPFALIAHA